MNKVRYIPVAVATRASIPIMTRTGQKIIPPPIPQNAEINAPNHPMNMNIATFAGVSFRSPVTNS